MTIKEAIERLQCMRLFMEINDKQNDSKFLEDDYIANEIAIQSLEEIQQYRAIGTIEEFKALKEKNMEKKPIRNDLCTCPSCGTHNEIIKKRRNTVAFDTVYCWHCGQAIEIKRD